VGLLFFLESRPPGNCVGLASRPSYVYNLHNAMGASFQYVHHQEAIQRSAGRRESRVLALGLL
jgi:hypothetical protein